MFYALEARRMLCCLLGSLYSLLPPLDHDPYVFALPASACDSLLSLVLGAPFMSRDLRASHFIYAAPIDGAAGRSLEPGTAESVGRMVMVCACRGCHQI